MVRHFIQGRVFAATYSEAIDKVIEHIRGMGHEPKGRSVRPYPCNTQHQSLIWWEFVTECDRKDGEEA